MPNVLALDSNFLILMSNVLLLFHFAPKSLNGSIKIFLTRSKLSSTAKPKRRKGSSSSHTKGYRINAAIAIGQQRINRMHQRIKVNMSFVFGF